MCYFYDGAQKSIGIVSYVNSEGLIVVTGVSLIDDNDSRYSGGSHPLLDEAYTLTVGKIALVVTYNGKTKKTLTNTI